MPIRVDQNYLPLLRVQFEGTPTDAEFEAHLETLSASMRTAGAAHRVVIIDATSAGQTPATQRRRQADWMKENAELMARLTLGSAFVIPSAVVRGALTAILWVQPLPCPHVVCATLEEALTWSEQKLRERGITPPLGARTAWMPRRAGAAR